jgi:Acyl-CoA thioesterase
MPSLSQLLSSFDPATGLELPASWQQGRTAYGGISTALAVAAAGAASEAPLPPLRSAQVSFIGPANGRLVFRPQLLRAGSSVVSMAVDVHAGAGLALRLALVFAQARDSSVAHSCAERPVVAPWSACPEFDMTRAPFAPAFTRHFQIRPAGGAMPLSGAEHPELMIWVRHRDAAGVDPLLALVAMGDALPPAVFTALRAPAPASSINWSFDVLDPTPRGDWFLLRSTSEHARDGYSAQAMQVWDENGGLVMLGRQSVAVFA